MKRIPSIVVLATFVIFLGMSAAFPTVGQDSAPKPAGQLVLFADTAVFADPSSPDNCTLKNRFKRGEFVGFRLYAVDGGTNKPDDSAKVVVHISSGGKTYDLPALFRGEPHKNEKGGAMPIRPNMWTAKWLVPEDAPTGTVHYSATATDQYGRTAQWTPPGGQPSFVTIVE
ncbi:MAG TPA: hypothetical protein VGP19_13390 [Candidatus Acidoferrales bacterium]|jgi:hypothetical protein|nr:hypothetical protein [Candidatus Acidoferrales bacterium]